ncbi:hypothetical protein L3Q82_006094 [Scortum barcoo]|uniref:Uncharacterized protein n=1 Tax=Scortum barcoo TaxID=214431 RepID=A0ACB8X3D1_9TELE|nr:hypothetical protein L3Q82_006094 [Scortum barcoo]
MWLECVSTFLQDEGIDAMDWPARSPDLNPIEHIWDTMSRSIHQHHVAPQTVQELADALVQVTAGHSEARATAQRSPDDTSDLSPASIYSLAGSHTGSTQTRGQTLPDSLYAQIRFSFTATLVLILNTHCTCTCVDDDFLSGSITETLFVQTGKDLLLDVEKRVDLGEGIDLIWSFNNVQKIDSGDYTAVVSGENNRLVAKYKVTVQDPVSPVKVTVSSCSSESCNLTVTCSTVDAHISSTFRCDNKTCSEEGGERSEDTTRPSSITVYLEQGFIICNHSNHVSWKQDKKEIKSFCKPTSDPTPLPNGAIAAIATGLCLCVIGTLLFIKYKKRQKGENKMDNGNTEYADPEEIFSTQMPNHNPQEGPTSTYAMDPSGLMVEDLNEPLSADLVDLLDHSKEKMNTSSSAVTPLFVLKGQDVLLNVTKADALQRDFDVFLWKHNEKDVIVRLYPNKKPKLSGNYTERIEISQKNYSVKLKNLQESDSGVYTARVVGVTEERIAEHRITVQDPVSPVQLTVDSVSNSSDSCNLDVTCSTLDYHISSTFRCDAQNCSQEGGERSEVTAFGASLHVYLKSDSIICDNSNKVSLTKNMTDIRHFCPRHAEANLAF